MADSIVALASNVHAVDEGHVLVTLRFELATRCHDVVRDELRKTGFWGLPKNADAHEIRVKAEIFDPLIQQSF
jgi:hypothetical protein